MNGFKIVDNNKHIVLDSCFSLDKYDGQNTIHMPMIYDVTKFGFKDIENIPNYFVLQIAKDRFWGVEKVIEYDKGSWVAVLWRPFPLNWFGMFL